MAYDAVTRHAFGDGWDARSAGHEWRGKSRGGAMINARTGIFEFRECTDNGTSVLFFTLQGKMFTLAEADR